jgi:hypothetical protein
MDWSYAIERNRDALKRVLAALVAMAGLVGSDAKFPSALRRRGATAAGRPRAMEMALGAISARSHAEGQDSRHRPTLPRHLHRAVLRLLRPAESAARRLVIVAARGVAVTLPRQRPRRPKSASPVGRPGTVTGIWMPPQLQPDRASSARRRAPATRALPLFDRLPQSRGAHRKASGTPRICLPGFSAPHPLPLKRMSKGSPDDPVDAARLQGRLAALASALDDLPRAATRFARWQARRAQAAGARSPGRACRVWPLKPGRPPGSSARSGHAVDDILKDAHSLAAHAMEHPDSS